MSIGSQVKRLRKAQRLSQRALASKAGISQAAVSRLENGGADSFRVASLRKVARVLGTNIDDLRGRQRCPIGRLHDFTISTKRPIASAELADAIKQYLAEQECCDGSPAYIFIVEQHSEDGLWTTTIEMKRLRSWSRRATLVDKVVACALASPLSGAYRLSLQLRTQRIFVGSSTVQNILVEKELGTRLDRARCLQRKADAGEIVLSEKQKLAIKKMTSRHGESPGHSDETPS